MNDNNSNDKHIKYDDPTFNNSVKDFRNTVNNSSYVFGFVGKFILLIVIGFPVIQFLFNGNANSVNLQSLMQIFQSAPTIDMSWFSKLTTGGIPGLNERWELFDGFRVFLSYISEGVLFLAWLVTGVVNCITFISYFVMQMMTM